MLRLRDAETWRGGSDTDGRGGDGTYKRSDKVKREAIRRGRIYFRLD